MKRKQLKEWLKKQRLGQVILVCPVCGKVDIDPKTHFDECVVK